MAVANHRLHFCWCNLLERLVNKLLCMNRVPIDDCVEPFAFEPIFDDTKAPFDRIVLGSMRCIDDASDA